MSIRLSRRWPWALLQGAYNGSMMGLDPPSLVSAISGERLVRLQLDNLDDYCRKRKDNLCQRAMLTARASFRASRSYPNMATKQQLECPDASR